MTETPGTDPTIPASGDAADVPPPPPPVGDPELTAPITPTPAPNADPAPEVGYWEKHAQEQQAQQLHGVTDNPWGPPVAPPAPAEAPAAPSYAAPADYSQPTPDYSAGTPAAAPNPYQVPVAPGGNPYATSYQVVPDHPSATTALVLGLISLIGGFVLCGLPWFVAPFAWVIGSRVVREVDASNGQLGGRGNGQAGMIMGIIGTALLVLSLLAIIALFALGAMSANGSI